MGNKSRYVNPVNRNLQETVAKLYKRVAEMEIGLAQTSIRNEAIVKIMLDSGKISKEDFDATVKTIVKEVYKLPEEAKVDISTKPEDKPVVEELTEEDLQLKEETPTVEPQENSKEEKTENSVENKIQ
jgi:D-mannonate dehydratase